MKAALVIAIATSMGLSPSASGTQEGPHVEPLVAGTVVHLPSEILGESRPITVQVPPDAGGAPLDVIVVLDAETHGYHVSGIVDFLAHRHVTRMPKTIVIGVVNTNRLHDTTPTPTARWTEGGGVRDFVHFLSEELLPWVDANYPTTDKRTLVGHSGSALAAMYALVETPTAFRNIIAVDPSIDWDDNIFLAHAERAWKSKPKVEARLLLSSYRDKPVMDKLERLLKQRAPRGLEWSLSMYEGETHNSMVHRAVYDGFEELYPPADH